MSTETWGPTIWHVLHVIAKSFPDKPTVNDKNTGYQMVKYLATCLPCEKCKKHYMSNFTKFPPKLNSGREFFIWTVKIHNLVNRTNGTKVYSPAEAYQITSNVLNSQRMANTFSYLVQESNYNNVSKQGLSKFIDCLTYLSRHQVGGWSIPDNKDVVTARKTQSSKKGNSRPVNRNSNNWNNYLNPFGLRKTYHMF